jgi:hypothetical protein
LNIDLFDMQILLLAIDLHEPRMQEPMSAGFSRKDELFKIYTEGNLVDRYGALRGLLEY